MRVEYGVVEAFEGPHTGTLISRLTTAFGKSDLASRHDPDRDEARRQDQSPKRDAEREIRGGAHLLGKMWRRVWIVPANHPALVAADPHGPFGFSEMAKDVERLSLELHWAENVPFTVFYARFRFRPGTAHRRGDLAMGLDNLVDALIADWPGHASAGNYHPRVQGRWTLGAKVNQREMDALRTATRTNDARAFRTRLRKSIPILGAIDAPILVNSSASNVLAVFASAGGFLGANGELQGEFGVYLFSSGNLISEDAAWDYFLAFWALPTFFVVHWHDFHFWPFMEASRRFATHVLIENGRVDETLALVGSELERVSHEGIRQRAAHWNRMLPRLLTLQARVEHLSLILAASVSRSSFPAPTPSTTSDDGMELHRKFDADRAGLSWLSLPTVWVEYMATEKARTEIAARQLAESLKGRLKSIQETALADFQVWAVKSTRFWAIASNVLAIVAIIVAGVAIAAR